MRDFQEFIDKKIAVSFVDEKQRMEFLKLCGENGLTWCNKLSTDFTPMNLDTITVGYGGRKYLEHSRAYFYSDEGYEIVPASEFLQQPPTIEIFQSKQTVVCLKKQDGKVVAVGKAKCNPEDEFDFDYGAKLAFERMEMDITRRNIVNAGECLARGLKEGIKGAVDALKELSDEMNGIKTLKNGMRIKKQDVYEVGDRVLLKKKIIDMFLENGVSVESIVEIKRFYNNECCINGITCNSGYPRGVSNSDIKGKVIQ